MNVNIVLFLLYLASKDVALKNDRVVMLEKHIEVLSRATEVQREKRRALKGSDDYKSALQIELDLEVQQQQSLVGWLNSNSKDSSLSSVGRPLTETIVNQLQFYASLNLDCPDLSRQHPSFVKSNQSSIQKKIDILVKSFNSGQCTQSEY